MRIDTVPWLYAKDMEIDILTTLEENFEKCPPPWPFPEYAPEYGIISPIIKINLLSAGSIHHAQFFI